MQLAAAHVAGFDPKPEGVPTSINWACNYKRTSRILLVHNLHSPLWTQYVWELKPSVTNGAAVAPVPSTLAATLPALHCFRQHLPAPNQAVPKLVTHWKWGGSPYLRAAVHLTISLWNINLNGSHRCPSSSFSYISHAGFIFIWGVSLTYPVLASFLTGEFLLHIPCWLNLYLGSFSYTSRAGFNFISGVSLKQPMLASFFIWGVSLPQPLLVSFFFFFFFFFFYLGSFSYTTRAGFIFISGVFLHIPCWLHLYMESFSYTSRAGLIFMWGISLPHPVLASFLSGEFLLHIPRWCHFYVGSSLIHPALALILSADSLLHIHAGFIFIRGVSLTHPVLALVSSGEFLLHIPRWCHFYLGCFSYTSRAGFNFISGLSLTYPCWLNFYLGSFSYTSRAGFMFMQGVSLTQPMLTPKEELVFFFPFDFSVAFQAVLGLVFDVNEPKRQPH